MRKSRNDRKSPQAIRDRINRYQQMGLGHYNANNNDVWLIQELDKLQKYWKAFLDMHDPSLVEGTDYFVNRRNLCEVVQRVDKRAAYYYVFHKNIEICEYKWVGLCAYWVNTLKPFMVVKEDSVLYSCPNEMFSLFLIISVVRRIFEKLKEKSPEKFEGKVFSYLSGAEIKDTIYSFKYCDLSRESMLLFVEMFARSCGVGMDMLPPDDKDRYEV